MSAGHIVLSLIVMALILLLNAFFVIAEFALVASRRSKIKEMAEDGNAAALLVGKLQQDIGRSVSGTQLGITLCSLGLGWVADHSVNQLMGLLLGLIPGVGEIIVPSGVGMVISFLTLSSMHVVLGEQVPKFLAISNPEKVALRIARPFSIYCTFAWPLIWVLEKSGAGVLRCIGLRKTGHDSHESAHSPDELEILFDESLKAGQLDKRETDLLKRVLDLRDLSMESVMLPVAKVDAVSIDMSLPALLKVVAKTKHSRLPVYRGNINTIVGVLYCRDLFDWWSSTMFNCNRAAKDFKPEKFIRPAFVVEITHKASALLDEMRKRKVQIAIVKDGSKTVGLVTMEDLLEELVGEIYDEHDKPAKPN